MLYHLFFVSAMLKKRASVRPMYVLGPFNGFKLAIPRIRSEHSTTVLTLIRHNTKLDLSVFDMSRSRDSDDAMSCSEQFSGGLLWGGEGVDSVSRRRKSLVISL